MPYKFIFVVRKHPYLQDSYLFKPRQGTWMALAIGAARNMKKWRAKFPLVICSANQPYVSGCTSSKYLWLKHKRGVQNEPSMHAAERERERERERKKKKKTTNSPAPFTHHFCPVSPPPKHACIDQTIPSKNPALVCLQHRVLDLVPHFCGGLAHDLHHAARPLATSKPR